MVMECCHEMNSSAYDVCMFFTSVGCFSALQEKTEDENKIREEILSLIANHVKAVNHIYSNTLFDGDKETYKNIRFEVQRIKVRIYSLA